jgi:hypothetical protein
MLLLVMALHRLRLLLSVGVVQFSHNRPAPARHCRYQAPEGTCSQHDTICHQSATVLCYAVHKPILGSSSTPGWGHTSSSLHVLSIARVQVDDATMTPVAASATTATATATARQKSLPVLLLLLLTRGPQGRWLLPR